MRIQEIVATIATPDGSLVDATSGRVGPLPHTREPRLGEPSSALAGDVLIVDDDESGPGLEESLARVAADVDVLVLLRERPDQVPVGRICGAVDRAAMRLEWALPLDHAEYRTVLVAVRADSTRPARLVPYLGGGAPVELTEQGTRAFVAEALVSGLANRARLTDVEASEKQFGRLEAALRGDLRERESELERLKAELAEERSNRIGLQRQLDATIASRPYRLGAAMGNLRRHPFSGLREFPSLMRGGEQKQR